MRKLHQTISTSRDMLTYKMIWRMLDACQVRDSETLIDHIEEEETIREWLFDCDICLEDEGFKVFLLLSGSLRLVGVAAAGAAGGLQADDTTHK